MSEELGSVYTAEVESVFTTMFNRINQELAKANEKQIVKDSLNAIKAQNVNIGAKILIK